MAINLEKNKFLTYQEANKWFYFNRIFLFGGNLFLLVAAQFNSIFYIFFCSCLPFSIGKLIFAYSQMRNYKLGVKYLSHPYLDFFEKAENITQHYKQLYKAEYKGIQITGVYKGKSICIFFDASGHPFIAFPNVNLVFENQNDCAYFERSLRKKFKAHSWSNRIYSTRNIQHIYLKLKFGDYDSADQLAKTVDELITEFPSPGFIKGFKHSDIEETMGSILHFEFEKNLYK